ALKDAAPKAAPEATEEKATTAHMLLTNKGKRRIAIAAIVAIAIIAGTVSFFSAYKKFHKARPAEAARAAGTVDQIKGVIARLGMSKHLEVNEYKGATVITGYIKTNKDKMRLVEALNGANLRAAMKAYVEEDMVTAAEGIVAFSGLSLKVENMGDGAIKLSGYITAAGMVEEVRKNLTRDVSGITRVDADLLTLDMIAADLKSILDKDAIGTVAIRAAAGDTRKGVIELTGIMTKEAKKKWDSLKDGFLSKYNDYIVFKESVAFSDISLIYENCRTNKYDNYAIMKKSRDTILTNVPQCYN
ncbi:MAG: hypothetical protein HQL01_09785, partial [Nitrospirae bacterium]|nr:hypothetical protein [Nitrospirota bacterium]